MSKPILYSFRRCPYAIRARMCLSIAGIEVEIREVKLSNKPQAMLEASAKGTVPILILADGLVIDESLDIMQWASQQMPKLLQPWSKEHRLIQKNDQVFKRQLDRYKYFERYPERSQSEYRAQAEIFLTELDANLQNKSFLLGDVWSPVDIALFPFVRQFALVDKAWFFSSRYQSLQDWLAYWLDSATFKVIMAKHPIWQP